MKQKQLEGKKLQYWNFNQSYGIWLYLDNAPSILLEKVDLQKELGYRISLPADEK